MKIDATNGRALSISHFTASVRKSSVLGLWSSGDSTDCCGPVHGA
jgi:hypothetical protein